jgi:anti-sigma B factor antagonist
MDEDATLTLRVKRAESKLVIWIGGELDIYTSARLRRCFRDQLVDDAAFPRHVVLDLGDLDFVDSTGLQAVVAIAKELRARGRDLTLLSPGHRVLRVLEMTGLDQVFHIDDGDEPLEAVAKAPRGSGAGSNR